MQSMIIEQSKSVVIDCQWTATIDKDIHTETDRISQRLTHWIKELAERYETPLPKMTNDVVDLEKTVQTHFAKMGFVWK